MTGQPYYGPDEPAATIAIERFFLAGDFISGVAYGVHVVLWTSCAMYLWKQRHRGWRTLFLLGFISLLFIVETMFAIVQARTVEVIYINNRNYPGGPWSYFLASQNLAINVIFYATLFVMTFLCDTLMLWRSWIIWTASGRTTAYLVNLVPFIMLVASFVMGTLWTLQSSHPGLSLYSKQPLAYGTAYYTISLGVNIILTALIIARLLMYRRTHLAHLPPEHAQQYLSLAALIVESAALYSVFAIAFLVSYAMNAPINQIWLGFASGAQPIATYLIIYRVADGTAWTKDTMNSQTLTSMNFRQTNVSAGPAARKRGDGPSGVQFTTEFSLSALDVESSHEK
ncbi:hypothetical protein OH77DRAFT_1428820 [Trametes cingulata]|nr:hypothetical protein OH77DRAFT_1428820 [Trametes cingulata]